jgi:predicted regulator of Ras-like GTPase activity (Roadblock/LC7/MglB family)
MRHAHKRRWFSRRRAAPALGPVCIDAPSRPVFAPPPAPVAPVVRAEVSIDDRSDAVSKQVELHEVLRGFQSAVDGVHGAVLATRDGLPVVSTLADAGAETVAAMAATVISLAEQAMPSDPDGAGEGHTVIRGSGGCLVVYAAGDAAVLAVQTTATPNIGLVQVEAPATARELASLLA